VACCILQHFGRSGTPAAIHIDHNLHIQELTQLAGKEENDIVERATRHLREIQFDKRVSYAWSYEELTILEKISTGVTPAEPFAEPPEF